MANETTAELHRALEYDIFVPLVQASGERYAQNITQGIKAAIIEYFGGITDSRHALEGWWKVGGMHLRDELIIWRILSDKGPNGDAFIHDIKKRLENTLQQDLILVIRRQVEILG